MTTRILKCLDLCEASGLFDPARVDLARDAVRVGLSAGKLPVRDFPDLISLSIRERAKDAMVEVDRWAMWSYEAITFAATLTRVAALARECDRVLGGGE